MKIHLLVVLVFLSLTFCCRAQYSSDYYIKDSVAYYGVKLENFGLRRNCQKCVEIVKGNQTFHTPNQVSEYGFGHSSTYAAITIELHGLKKCVFAQRKQVGRYTLFHYQDSYNDVFVLQQGEKWSRILLKDNDEGHYYLDMLNELAEGNPSGMASLRRVEFDLESIERFLEKCQGIVRPALPRATIGLSIGTDWTLLQPVQDYITPDFGLFNFQYDAGYAVGLVAELPFTHKGLSFHTGCQLTNAAFSYTYANPKTNIDFVANLHTLQLPLQVRYTYLRGVLNPFLESGGLFAWNIYQSNVVRQTNFNGRQLEYLGLQTYDLMYDYYFGPTVGCGLEWRPKGHLRLFLEGRYAYLIGLTDPKLFALSKFNLTTGIAF